MRQLSVRHSWVERQLVTSNAAVFHRYRNKVFPIQREPVTIVASKRSAIMQIRYQIRIQVAIVRKLEIRHLTRIAHIFDNRLPFKYEPGAGSAANRFQQMRRERWMRQLRKAVHWPGVHVANPLPGLGVAIDAQRVSPNHKMRIRFVVLMMASGTSWRRAERIQ